MFVPGDALYSNVTSDLADQNFILVTPAALTLAESAARRQPEPRLVRANGVTYQVLIQLTW